MHQHYGTGYCYVVSFLLLLGTKEGYRKVLILVCIGQNILGVFERSFDEPSKCLCYTYDLFVHTCNSFESFLFSLPVCIVGRHININVEDQ